MTGSQQGWEAPRQQRRGRAVAVAAALVVLVALAARAAGVPAGDQDEGAPDGADASGALEVRDGGGENESPPPPSPRAGVSPGPSPSPSPGPSPPAGASATGPARPSRTLEPAGSWREIAAAPIDGRTGALAVWTGSEVVVWGGVTAQDGSLADGAAYDPGADRWRTIAVAPRPGHREQASVLWTGAEMLVLGTEPPMAFDPRRDAWRDLAAAPDGQWVWSSAGWSGERAVVVARSALHEQRRAAVAYDPGQDSWELLPPPPLDGSLASVSAVLDGRIVVTGLVDTIEPARTAVAAYDPRAGSWGVPNAAPAPGRWFSRLVADPSRGRVLATGGGGGLAPGPVRAWSVDGGWREIVDLPEWLTGGQPDAFWTGEELLVWHGDTPSSGALLSEREFTVGWRPVRDSPLDPRRGHVAVWTGDELVVWGGGADGSEFADGAAFAAQEPGWQYADAPDGIEVLDGGWRRLAAPGFTRDNPSLDWTGAELLLWGGAAGRHVPSGSAYDPAADTWRRLADAPVTGRQQHLSAWTGSELLVLGGVAQGGLQDGAAYDPTRDAWRELPEPPLGEPHGLVGAWTGEEWLVVAGGAEGRAAAYDPTADRWTALPDPPPHGHRHGAVWTGAELVVVSDAVEGTVIRYDPAAGAWRGGADNPQSTPSYGVEVAWTGEEVLLWGGAVDEPSARGWAYHPGRDTWRRLPDSWLTGTINAAGSVWTGRHWVVLGSDDEHRMGFAAYDPAGDRWLSLPEPYARVLATGPLAWTGSEVVVWSMFGEALAFRPGG